MPTQLIDPDKLTDQNIKEAVRGLLKHATESVDLTGTRIMALHEETKELRLETRAGFERLTDEVHDLKGEVIGVKSEIKELKGEVIGVKSEVIGVKSEIKELKGEVIGVKSEIKELKGEVDDLNQ